MVYKLTRADLISKLHEQVGFLRSSAQRFDAGIESEAVRLAVVARVLLHDTRGSKSLLGLLGLKETILYVDTAKPIPPDTHVPPQSGQPGSITRTVGSALASLTSKGGAWAFEAPLSNRSSRREIDFTTWWTGEVSRGPRGVSATRQDVVLALANQEGGAHVDPILDEEWGLVTRAGSFSSVAPSGAEKRLNPAAAMMRQIAHELDLTLSERSVAGTAELPKSPVRA